MNPFIRVLSDVTKTVKSRAGSLSGNLLLWLLGVPLPIILLISLLRGCR